LPDIYIASKKKTKKRTKKPFVKALAKIGIEPTTNHLASFVALPKKIKFETQEKEEKIVLLLRRHWITNFSWLLSVLVMTLAPFLLLKLPLLEFLPFRYQLMAVMMWYLLTLGFVFDRFLCWFYNVFIITDERIIDVDFFSLVYREVSQAKIENIQDVTYKTGGFLRTIFDYGDVFVQTAAEKLTIEFESIPQPAKVVQILNQLITQEEQEKIEGRVR
jgi:membrane protein YdbS with pleckstrin-like domain